MSEQQRLAYIVEREAPDGHRWYRLVTQHRDDHGTVILPAGGDLSRHRANPVWLWMHSSGPKRISPQTPHPQAAIGAVAEYDQNELYLDLLVRFDLGDEFARLVYRKTAAGFLRACSVGFDPIEVVERTPETAEESARWGVPMGEKVPVITRWTLLEGSSVILGSNEEALALLRALPEHAGRGAPERTTFPETFPDNKQEPRMTKMKPEHRWICRGIIGAHMQTAEGHLRAMEHAGGEHVLVHREACVREMEGAEKMATMMRESEDDDDMMRKARRLQARSAPDAAPSDLRERFNTLAETVKLLDVVDARDVLRATLETDDPERADARICALQATQERYKALCEEVSQNREDAFAAEREKEVSALLDQRLMTPSQAKRAREERWPLAKIGEFRAEAEKAGPVVEIVRQRPLNTVDERGLPRHAGGQAGVGSGNSGGGVTPAPTQDRRPGEGRGGGRGAEVEATVRAMAERAGLDPSKVEATFAKWRDGRGRVGFDEGATQF